MPKLAALSSLVLFSASSEKIIGLKIEAISTERQSATPDGDLNQELPDFRFLDYMYPYDIAHTVNTKQTSWERALKALSSPEPEIG